MDDAAAQALAAIVTEKGRQILQDVRRCQSLIQDHSPSTRRENTVLIEALKADIPRRLLTLPSGTFLSETTITKLASTLAEETGFSTDAAQWAVRSWAGALKLPIAKGEPQTMPIAPAATPVQVAPPPAAARFEWKEPEWKQKAMPAVGRAPRDPEAIAGTIGTILAYVVMVAVTAAAVVGTIVLLFWSCKYLPGCGTASNGSFTYWAPFGLIVILVGRFVWWLFHRGQEN